MSCQIMEARNVSADSLRTYGIKGLTMVCRLVLPSRLCSRLSKGQPPPQAGSSSAD